MAEIIVIIICILFAVIAYRKDRRDKQRETLRGYMTRQAVK